MADKKISALGASTTPLAGTEVLPIVQSGSTVQVSVANLTAGRSVSASSLSLTATPLGVTSGGTGASTLTSGYVVKGNGTSAVSASIAYDTGTNFGVGTTTPNRKLTIATTSGDPTNGLGIQFDGSEVASYTSNASTGEIRIGSTGIGSFFLTFYCVNTERMRISTGGDITATSGNLVIGTAGKGIDFSANANLAGKTSEILNWYEEGTWTPTVTSQTGSITTYASGGTYTRVGRQVTVTAYVDLTNVGTAGGFLQISNFPYKNGGASGAGYLQQMGVVRETGVTGVIYAAFLAGNSTNGYVSSLAGGAVIWLNSYQYAISMTYYTA